MKKFLPLVIIAVVLIVALGGVALLMKAPSTPVTSNSTANPSAAQSATRATNTAPATAPVTATPAPIIVPDEQPAHVRGRADAPVLIEEFGDFQCPPCGLFHVTMSRIERDFPAQVRFAFHHYPIKTQHKHAESAARATEAAGMQGKFWELHDLIYDKQKDWKDATDARPIFTNYAKSLGLNLPKFTQDIDGAQAAARIATDERRAQRIGVTGTPTVFMNGRELPFEQVMTYERFRDAINAEIAKLKR